MGNTQNGIPNIITDTKTDFRRPPKEPGELENLEENSTSYESNNYELIQNLDNNNINKDIKSILFRRDTDSTFALDIIRECSEKKYKDNSYIFSKSLLLK